MWAWLRSLTGWACAGAPLAETMLGNIDDTGGLIPVISDFAPLPRGPQGSSGSHMDCFAQWGDFKAVDLLGGFINDNEVRTFRCRGCDSG